MLKLLIVIYTCVIVACTGNNGFYMNGHAQMGMPFTMQQGMFMGGPISSPYCPEDNFNNFRPPYMGGQPTYMGGNFHNFYPGNFHQRNFNPMWNVYPQWNSGIQRFPMIPHGNQPIVNQPFVPGHVDPLPTGGAGNNLPPDFGVPLSPLDIQQH